MAFKILNTFLTKYVLRLSVILCSIFVAYNAAMADFPAARIAIVDVPAVFDKSVAVKSLRSQIDVLSEQFSKELSAKEVEFKKMEADLTKRRDTTKRDLFEKEVDAFYKKLSHFQQEAQKKKERLERAHAAAIDVVHDHTLKIVQQISKERQFNIAIPMSHTLYVAGGMDITPEVIDRLNNVLKEVPLKMGK